jgi:hypothetical protein
MFKLAHDSEAGGLKVTLEPQFEYELVVGKGGTSQEAGDTTTLVNKTTGEVLLKLTGGQPGKNGGGGGAGGATA